MKKPPIPFPLIEKMEDRPLVGCLLKRMPDETNQFLYGKYYPLFRKLFLFFYTDCLDEVELTDDVYVHLMEPRGEKKISRLEEFQFQCHLARWMKLVSIRFCITKWKRHRDVTFFESAEELPVSENSHLSATVDIDREDFEKIVDLMRNERYKKLIRFRYLEGMDHDEIAEEMGEKMSDYYRTHERAKKQLREVYMKEMGQ